MKKLVQPDEWISQAEAARIRGISRPGLYDLVRRGRLKSLEIGGKVLVNRAEVEAFVPMPIGRPRKKVVVAKSLGLGKTKKS